MEFRIFFSSIVRENRQKTIDEITPVIDHDRCRFISHDFSVLDEPIQILEPFVEITIKCQSETIVTISMTVPAIVPIIYHLKQITCNVSVLTKLVIQLNRSINVRFSGIAKRLRMSPVTENDPFNDPLFFTSGDTRRCSGK